ncbi:chitin binding domain-containing protein [Aspergillus aurantiobrunneus]
MKQASSILAMAGLVSFANAHGYITTPKPRLPGDAMSAACGQQVYNNQAADRAGNVQGELQVASGQSDYDEAACGIWLCKGYQFEDNTENVQSYTPGQNVDFVIDIIAPHTGVANVSIVDTATNTVIGSPLKEWKDNYASTETGVSDDETNFSVTIPEDLGSQCSEAGACVIQWYWFAESIDQTYESCVDFTVAGNGSGSGSGSGETQPSSSSAASTTAPASTSSASTTTAAPTTLSTATRPAQTENAAKATVPATPSGADAAVPTEGTADEQLNWVSSIIKAVYSRD